MLLLLFLFVVYCFLLNPRSIIVESTFFSCFVFRLFYILLFSFFSLSFSVHHRLPYTRVLSQSRKQQSDGRRKAVPKCCGFSFFIQLTFCFQASPLTLFVAKSRMMYATEHFSKLIVVEL